MIKFNRTCGSAGYIKTLLGKTLLGALFIFLFTSCASSPSSPSGEGGLKISFQNSSLRQAEGVDFEWRVQLNKQIEQDVSFDWSIEHLTTSNDDFRDATEGSGIITVGSTTANITIKTNNDNTFESNESFKLKIINIRGATLDNSLQATGTIKDEEDRPTISLDPDFTTIAEGDFFTWSLKLSNPVKQDVSFDWRIEHVSTDNNDFIDTTKGSSSIVAGSLEKIIAIQTFSNGDFEGDESFVLNITEITIATPNNLKITNIIITDDADNSNPVLFIPNQKTILKEGESDTIRVSLNRATNSSINFSWQLQDRQLQDGSNDFINATGLGSIAANSTTTDIVINASNDNIYEATEDFRFTISSDTILSTMKFTQIKIDDRDDIPSISITEASADETDGVINFELTLSNLSEVAIPFSWSLDELLGAADSDFAQTSGTGNFAIGSLDTSFDVVITNDEIYEGDETFTITITNGVDNEVTSAVATIRDNGDFPTIDFQEPSLTQKEGEDFVWIVQLSNHAEHGVSFDWSIEHVSTDNNDFIATTGSGSIAAASTQASIIITTSNDSIFESNESFRLNVTNITSINTINIGGPTLRDLRATGTITDEEDRPTISLVDGFARIIVEGDPFTWSLRLTNLVKQDVSFDWSIEHVSTDNNDFIDTTGSGSIAAGSLEKSFTIQTFSNGDFEGDESFVLNITNITIATPNNLKITNIIITDDADNSKPVLFIPNQKTILKEGSSDTIRVSLNHTTNSSINFSWQLQDGSNDFINATGLGSIAANSTTTDIVINASNDNIYEATEDFRFTISSDTILSTMKFTQIKIDDRDDIPSISIIKDASADETDGVINFKLTLSNLSEVAIPFSWSLDNSLGAADSDFAQTSGSTGIFVANQLKANFDVAITNDEIYEGDETFDITITNRVNNEATSAVATIKDSEDFPSITLEPSLTKAEGEDFVWHLQLSKQAEHGISFEWSIAHSTTTSDDFIATTGSGSIAANSTQEDIIITTSNDSVFESDESFRLNVTNITIINIAGPTIENLQATGTIRDDADRPTILFAVTNKNTVAEGEDFVLMLQLSNLAEQDVSLDWSIEHGTTSNDDFSSINIGGTISIPAGRSEYNVDLSIVNDDIYEATEDFKFTILSDFDVLTESFTISIDDKDDIPSISIKNASANENDGIISFELSFDKFSEIDIPFSWSLDNSLGTADSDFAQTSGEGTIDANLLELKTSFDVVIINDEIYEGNETFTITITNGLNNEATSAVATISDILTINLKESSLTKAEGVDFVFILEIDATNEQNISFDWSIEHGTTNNDDFIGATKDSGIIAVDSTTTTITITTSNDSIFEGNESFRLKIENIKAATLDLVDIKPATGTITDEADRPTISLDAIDKRVLEGGSFTWSLQLSKQTKHGVSFEWSIGHLTTNNDDFEGAITAVNGSIAAGNTTTDITIKTSSSDSFEVNKSFVLNITNIRGATPDNLQATGTIAGDNKKLINIGTPQELDNIRHNLAGTSYKTSASAVGIKCGDASCEGYELIGNIDLGSFNGGDWDPIGLDLMGRAPTGKDTSFESTLKGNGYSISGLNISESGANHVGLFRSLGGASIDNLIIKVKKITGGRFVGALAGSAYDNSMIDNIQIKKTGADSELQVGGSSAGALIGGVDNSVITNAFSDLNIITESQYTQNIGGLLGIASAKSRISYSAASGNLRTVEGTNHGGLVGLLDDSHISYSWASGNLQGTEATYLGGLVGEVKGSSISNSWASGSVTGGDLRVGSFAGITTNSSTVEYNYSLGTVFGSEIGFIGQNKGTTTNNYWNRETSKVTSAVGSLTSFSDSDGISSSATDGMLTSSGITSDTAFSTWSSQMNADSNNKVWSFADASSYPVLSGQDATFQAINLAYGLLRLAGNNADSFLGGTLINEKITLSVTDPQNDFAILDVNLRASNDTSRRDFFACTGGNTLVSQSINGTRVELSINQQGTSSNLLNGLDFNNNNCSLSFKDTVTLTSGKTLRLDAKVSKGTGKWEVSQTKVFIINFI